MRRGNALLIGLLVVAGVGVAIGSYYFGRQQAGLRSESRTEFSDQPVVIPEVSVYPTSTPLVPTAVVTGMPESKTIVVFEAEGSISAADKNQLQQRVVNPFVDYYKEANPGDLVTLTISPNTQPNKTTYPYLGQAILSNGGNLGFTIEKKVGEIAWWYPECMTICPLSQTYQTTYPEVAKIVGY